MTVVLDTNALVRLFRPLSPLHPLKQALLSGRLTIAAEADYIITGDHNFEALKDSGFKPRPITPENFIRRVFQP